MSDQILSGNFVVDRTIKVQIPGGLAPEHGLAPGCFLAKFCRPLTQCFNPTDWLSRWKQLTEELGAQPLGFMGMVLLWQYHLTLLPKGHSLTHDDADFSSLCHMFCVTGKDKSVVMFQQRIDLAMLPQKCGFICFCPQV